MDLREYAKSKGYTDNVKGDACQGDQIAFVEGVFSGSYRNAKFEGHRLILGTIVKDSYGADKQQHTFTIEVAEVQGERAYEIEIGKKIRRKGRNVYREFTLAIPRAEDERELKLREKHSRGDAARRERDFRRETGL